jgi:hypothetical protein
MATINHTIERVSDDGSSARLYMGLVWSLGLPILAYSLYQTTQLESHSWLVLALLTVAASLFSIRIPLKRKQAGSVAVSISDVFIYAGILLYGPCVAVILAAIEATTGSLKLKVKHFHKYLFNLSQLTVVAFLTAHVFYRLVGSNAPLSLAEVNLVGVLVPAVACAVLYFFLNTFAVAGAMALVAHMSVTDIWQKYFLWTSPTYLVNAITAVIALFSFRPMDAGMALATLPLMLGMYYAHRMRDRIASEQTEEGSHLLRFVNQRFFEAALSKRAKGYLATVSVAGCLFFVWSLHSAVTSTDLNWVYLCALTAAATCFPVRIALFKDRMWITLSDIFVFSALIHFGVEVAVVVAAVEGLTFNLRSGADKPYRTLFNVAQIVTVAFLVGHVFYLIQPGQLPLNTGQMADPKLIVTAIFCGALYFLLTSGMVSLAIALSCQKPLITVWKQSLPWAIVTLAGVAIGMTLFLRIETLFSNWTIVVESLFY